MRFIGSLEITTARLFRAQTAAGRLRERRLRGRMTCTRAVLERDRCRRMISAGGRGQVVPRGRSRRYKVCSSSAVWVPYAPWQVTCFPRLIICASTVDEQIVEIRKMASRGNTSCSHWAQLGDQYHATVQYSLKNQRCGPYRSFFCPSSASPGYTSPIRYSAHSSWLHFT